MTSADGTGGTNLTVIGSSGGDYYAADLQGFAPASFASSNLAFDVTVESSVHSGPGDRRRGG